MTDLWLRQDLKTSGGEECTIMWDRECIGTMTLVYREADHITGAVQLEPARFPHNSKKRVDSFVHQHVQSMVTALGVNSCEIRVTYSDYDQLISFGPYTLDGFDADVIDQVNVEEDYDYEYDWMETERFEDESLDEQNEYIMKRNGKMIGRKLEQKGTVTELELERDSLNCSFIAEDQSKAATWAKSEKMDDYTVVLTREDGDTLIYEVYQQSYGGLPIGKATVDISNDQLEGFIDFREPGQLAGRECIALLMMEELDKEMDYESFNLTMLFQNKPFEEFVYEVDQVH
jgi:hypothetical protein